MMKKWKSLLLLAVIYITFIALGLPDALLGSAWNQIRLDLDVALGTLGIMTIVVYIMSIISTYNAPKLLRLFQTKWIAAVSVLFTGTALILISQVTAFYQVLFFAIPLGIGAGAIDVSLNHYLTKNYQAHHMNYLHTFYGIGVTLGPSIMGLSLDFLSWRMGYIVVGSILIFISIILFLSFKLWKKETDEDKEEHNPIPMKVMLKTKGAIISMVIFLFYVHIESFLGVWIASYMHVAKHTTIVLSAYFTSIYYIGLTLGRLFSSFLSYKVDPKWLVRIGSIVIFLSAICLFIPLTTPFYMAVVLLLGLGSGPIYPNMMFLNSKQFSKEKISKIISFQMVIGYMGFGLITPLAGWMLDVISITIYPIVLVSGSFILMILVHQYLGFKNVFKLTKKQSV